jgi:two-component system LytT family response regulator
MKQTTEKISAIIIDDEIHARDIIKTYLKNHPDILITGETNNGFDAIQMILERQPDLIFLDIQMPELDGFAVLQSITGLEKIPVTIFTTAYDHYAIKAFEVNAVDYLLKPFQEERFGAAIAKAKKQILNSQPEHFVYESIKKLIKHLDIHPRSPDTQKYLQRILIKETKRVFFIKTEDISWIGASNYYSKVYTKQGKKYLFNESLASLEKKLDSQQFIRIHRSSIVNIDSIKELIPHFNGEYHVILNDSTKLKLSRNYKENLNSLMG